jgi:hypothetical protein
MRQNWRFSPRLAQTCSPAVENVRLVPPIAARRVDQFRLQRPRLRTRFTTSGRGLPRVLRRIETVADAARRSLPRRALELRFCGHIRQTCQHGFGGQHGVALPRIFRRCARCVVHQKPPCLGKMLRQSVAARSNQRRPLPCHYQVSGTCCATLEGPRNRGKKYGHAKSSTASRLTLSLRERTIRNCCREEPRTRATALPPPQPSPRRGRERLSNSCAACR